MASNDGLNGAVIVGVFDESGSSMASSGVDADGLPVAVDRPWPTASLGKVFTAAAVMQLVDAGLVDLDAPVAEYVDFPIWDKITVRYLLQHKSTLPTTNPFSALFRCPDEATIAEIEKLAGKEPGSTEPGETSSYSNTNYLVLGRLVGLVTGQDPGDYIQENVFQPLGMESTYWYESQEGPAPLRPLTDCGGLGETIGTDGAAITTIEDMDSFYRGLFSEGLFGAEILKQMLEMDSQVFGFRLGLGILEMVNDSYPDDLLYGFGGDGGSFKTAAFHDPAKSRTVVVFTAVGDQVSLLWEAIDWANQLTN